MATFSLTIELHDDTDNGDAIADALISIAGGLTRGDYIPGDTRYGANQGTIRDINGNTVGSWDIREDENQ